MKHYDEVEWRLYKENLIYGQLKREMEDHLYSCDKCLDIFLSLVDDEEIELAANIIEDDFTDRILNGIGEEKVVRFEDVKKKKKISRRFFMQYVAVAVIAVVFTASGLFTDLAMANSERYTKPREFSLTLEIYERKQNIKEKINEGLEGTGAYIDTLFNRGGKNNE